MNIFCIRKYTDLLRADKYKKCNAIILYFFIVIILQCVGLKGAHSADLIINGDFEKKTSAGIGASWRDNSKWADVDVEYNQVLDLARKGYVQKIVCNRFNRGAVQFVQAGIKLEAGVSYHVRFWAKGSIDSPVEIFLRKRGKPYTAYFSRAFKVVGQWREYSFTAPVNVSDSSAYFMLRFTGKGELFVDDVSVMEINSVSNVHVAQLGNLLGNGNFEVGIDGWGVNIRGTAPEHELPIRAQEIKPELDAIRRRNGKYALKIPMVQHSKFLLTSKNIILTPGIKHSLSLWIYSETKRKLHVAIRSGYIGRAKEYKKTFWAEPKWTRYMLTEELEPAEDDAYFIAVEGAGTGSVWIDAIQLEEGHVTAFKDSGPVEIGFLKDEIHPFFHTGERISIPVRTYSNKKISDCKIIVTSTDYYGDETLLQEEDCRSDSAMHRDITVKHQSMKLGYYRLVAKAIVDGELVSSSEYAIGVIPALSEGTVNEDSPFGAHARFAPGDLETARSLGVKWLRMNPPNGTKWSVIEKNKGHYKYYDKEIFLAKKAGFEILGSLDRTPRWSSDAPKNEWRFWSYPPRNLDDWEDYVYNIVSHYKDIIDYWEVWNEPDSDGFLKIPGFFSTERKPAIYVELLRRAYVAAKRANPNAVIVGGVATGHPPSRWLGQIIELGALDYMDIISFHFYTDGRPGDVLDSPTAVDIQEIKKLMRLKIGRTIPIWETESGLMYPKTEYSNLKEISPSYAVPGNEAVAYLIRNYIHLIASGVGKWFYYSMFTSHRIDRREATGFFEWDGAPRPLSVAYSVLSNNLNNLVYTDSYNVDESAVATRFSGKNRDLLVVSTKLWKHVGFHKVSMKLSDLYSNYEVFNVMGNEINFSMSNNSLEFEVSREPVYVVAYKN